MKISLSGRMYDPFPLKDAIEGAAKASYDGIELRTNKNHINTDMTKDDIKKTKKMLKDAGLKVSGIASFTGHYGSLTDEECEKQFDEFCKQVKLATEFDCSIIRHWAGKGHSKDATSQQWEKAAAWLGKAADHAKKHGVRIALELHHNTFIDSNARALKMISDVGSKNIGVIHDAQNLYHDSNPYGAETMPELKGLLYTAHFKDITDLIDDSNIDAYKYEDRYFCERFINRGALDQYSVIQGLMDIGYDDYLTVESGNMSLDPFTVAEFSCRELRKIINDLQNKS
jgi:sugar phosphate isomerase/epimerase